MECELTFSRVGTERWDMCRSYSVGDGETGSEIYRFVRHQPSDLARKTGTWRDKNGRNIHTGIVVRNSVGIGYAWPED